MAATKVLEAVGLSQQFVDGENQVDLFRDLALSVEAGEHLAIVGRSGAGKTSLLNLLAGLAMPSAGEVRLLGQAYHPRSATARDRWRAGRLGMVFQFHHLLGEFTALENVELGLRLAGKDRRQANSQAALWLERVGLGHRLNHQPAQLSGGERQRVAIARALAPEPPVVLMDEPTGNLDAETAQGIQTLLEKWVSEHNMALIIVTHDLSLASQSQRILRLANGQLEAEAVASSSP